MQYTRPLRALLIFAGLVAILVGVGGLFLPVAFQATGGVMLDGSTNLLNEMRASGGAVLACGLVVFAGAFVRPLAFAASLLATVLYLAYGLSRLFSMAVDGMPDATLAAIAVSELAIGLSAAAALVAFRDRKARG